MTKGAVAQHFLSGASVPQAMAAARGALEASGFKVKADRADARTGRLKAIWGSRLKAILVGHLPFGKLVKSGRRLGAEVEAYDQGNVVALRFAVVPYMELFNRPEVFLLSQGLMEKLTDDAFSRDKLNEVLSRMGSFASWSPTSPAAYPAWARESPVARRAAPYTRSRTGGGGLALLGLLLGLGLATAILLGRITFSDERMYWGMLIGGTPLLAGLLGRRAGLGALNGFLSLFVPLLALSLYIPSNVPNPEIMGNAFIALLGRLGAFVFLVLDILLGFAGLIVGAIGGGIGGKLLRRRPKYHA